jgi:hypothetical protein
MGSLEGEDGAAAEAGRISGWRGCERNERASPLLPLLPLLALLRQKRASERARGFASAKITRWRCC